MSVLCVTPARYESKRFSGKPLARQTGKPLIQHAYEAASRARRVDAVVVATDDERIRKAVEAFGGRAVMIRPGASCWEHFVVAPRVRGYGAPPSQRPRRKETRCPSR
ncbi:MAG TPA: hypothetical protein VFH53_09005, partial [Phycisphaerae bacterium]|nr:hypothetical protein [Phycisphaerae bacterium]